MFDTMPRRRAEEEQSALTLRVPTTLIEQVRQIAIREDRTLTAQLVRIIREWLELHAQTSGSQGDN